METWFDCGPPQQDPNEVYRHFFHPPSSREFLGAVTGTHVMRMKNHVGGYEYVV